MVNDVEKMVGICGLYCGTCPNFLAFEKNDRIMQKELSCSKGFSMEEIRCEGCLSDKVSNHCASCRHGFRQCAADHEVTWCFQCADFPCQRLEDFRHVHVVNGISHHIHVIDDLTYMKNHGIENWLNQQENKGKCVECGSMLYWFDRLCPHCHKENSLGS